jgi:hypothetical protein
MTQTITSDDLVRYIYSETTEAENAAIAQALANNWDLRESHRSLIATKDILSQVSLRSPSRTSLKVIMDCIQPEETYEMH